jgi:hypothetical protein
LFFYILTIQEWAYNGGHIDKETYMDQTNSILEQYNTSVQAYEDKFTGIDDFAERYGLKDFRLGLNRLKQGVVQVSNTQGTVKYLNLLVN